MQNVCNYLCPFFYEDGRPIIAGRVHFVSPDCSAAPSSLEDPDYIQVYDADGTLLDNPLSLDSSGIFSHQPFVSDGIDFRMIVEAPTDMDDSPWRQVCIIDSKAQVYSVTYSGTPSCASLAELRQTDPAVGKCLVLGYTGIGDGCPARVFSWVEELYGENYGTHVRSTIPDKVSAGTWVCEPSGFVDARWFGLVAGGSQDDPNDATDALTRCTNAYHNMAVYVPSGHYSLESSVSLNGLVIDRNTEFYPSSGTVTLTARNLENRGGHFNALDQNDSSSARVKLKTYGTLKTSWLVGTINEFLDGTLDFVDEIVFDGISSQGATSVTISKKTVWIHDGVSLNNNIALSDCFVFRRGSGRLDAVSFNIGTRNASVTLDIDGLRLGDANSSVEVNRSGMVAKNSDESYVMNLDFEKMEFVNGQHAGSFDATEIHFVSGGGGGSSIESTLDDSALSFSTSHNDSSEYSVDHLSIHVEEVFDATIDDNGIKFSKDYNGTTRYIGFDERDIDSYSVIGVKKGLAYPWTVRDIVQPEPVQGYNYSAIDISDAVVVEDYIIAKISHAAYNAPIVATVTATPTRGKVVKVVYVGTSTSIGNQDYDKSLLRLDDSNSNVLTYLQFGGSVTLVADGDGWNIDYNRV